MHLLHHRSLRLAALLASAALALPSAARADAADLARAATIIQRVLELNQKYSTTDVVLQAPEPIAGATGKYLLPVNADGSLTAWAEKALLAQVGNIAGEQAGSAAAKGLGSVVPGGSLAGGFLKKKGKETGAMVALGGADFVKGASTLSFDSIADYAVYLHAKLGQTADYAKAVQAAIALYPDLEKSYADSIGSALKLAQKVAAAAGAK